MIEKTDVILNHIHSIGIEIMRFFALPMAATIHRYHLEVFREKLDWGGIVLEGSGKTVDQQKRFTFTLHDVMDLHSIRIEERILGK
jgi:hypothetical protein